MASASRGTAVCTRHRIPIEPDSICAACLLEYPPPAPVRFNCLVCGAPRELEHTTCGGDACVRTWRALELSVAANLNTSLEAQLFSGRTGAPLGTAALPRYTAPRQPPELVPGLVDPQPVLIAGELPSSTFTLETLHYTTYGAFDVNAVPAPAPASSASRRAIALAGKIPHAK